MGIEIERKFLVTGGGWRTSDPTLYSQGYLSRDRSRTVRVRVAGETGFLTIKGPTNGTARAEFEYHIPLDDAIEMMTLCDGPIVTKYRHRVLHEGMVWEVDEFTGDNDGLIVAEIELSSDGQAFERPDWLGIEVTNDSRYFNSRLAVNPFRTWPENSLR